MSTIRQYWKPEPIWEGREVFVLGGGRSLFENNFDFNILEKELVVGCNDAYLHGPLICDICIFGDWKWRTLHLDNLRKYVKHGGIVVTNEPKSIANTRHTPWLKPMKRQDVGLYRDALGWNQNTGASAVNLALILGAGKVFLLGFDMHLGKDGEANWHENKLNRPRANVYERMLDNFKIVAAQLPKVFPGQKVFNVHDDTYLKSFPILPFNEFWIQRRKEQNVC